MLRIAVLQETRQFFNHESGAYAMVIEEYPPDHEMWRSYPPPASFKVGPDYTTTRAVMYPQADTTFLGVSLISEHESLPPALLVHTAITWLLPELVRRLLKT